MLLPAVWTSSVLHLERTECTQLANSKAYLGIPSCRPPKNTVCQPSSNGWAFCGQLWNFSTMNFISFCYPNTQIVKKDTIFWKYNRWSGTEAWIWPQEKAVSDNSRRSTARSQVFHSFTIKLPAPKRQSSQDAREISESSTKVHYIVTQKA